MLIFFLVALTASVAGAICGIGGGVIIKPVLDLLHLETVTAISFLSGCTVLSMSCYSVGKSLLAKEHSVSLNVGTPLALGAAAGGLAGNQLFAAVRELSGSPDTVGAVQAACLAVVTAGTLLYTVNKSRISTRRVQNFAACVVIGLALGAMSSFWASAAGLSIWWCCTTFSAWTPRPPPPTACISSCSARYAICSPRFAPARSRRSAGPYWH